MGATYTSLVTSEVSMESTATAIPIMRMRYIPVELVMSRNVTRPITASAYNQDIVKRLVCIGLAMRD